MKLLVTDPRAELALLSNQLDTELDLNSGRFNQKHRTRNALLLAAAELMRQGRVPSIEEVADAAQVSRATAYRYFPTQEHVLAGSAVLSANLDGEQRLEAAMTAIDAPARLERVVAIFHERFATNEIAYRTLLSIMLQRPAAGSDAEEQPQVRASRHLHWVQEALAPVQQQIGVGRFGQLVASLVAATGFEAYTALRDACGLAPADAKEVMRWTAQALLAAALADAEANEQSEPLREQERAS